MKLGVAIAFASLGVWTMAKALPMISGGWYPDGLSLLGMVLPFSFAIGFFESWRGER